MQADAYPILNTSVFLELDYLKVMVDQSGWVLGTPINTRQTLSGG